MQHSPVARPKVCFRPPYLSREGLTYPLPLGKHLSSSLNPSQKCVETSIYHLENLEHSPTELGGLDRADAIGDPGDHVEGDLGPLSPSADA